MRDDVLLAIECSRPVALLTGGGNLITLDAVRQAIRNEWRTSDGQVFKRPEAI